MGICILFDLVGFKFPMKTILLIAIAIFATTQLMAKNLIVINCSTQTGTFYRERVAVKGFIDFPVATGRLDHETPIGTWKIISAKPKDRSSKFDVYMPFCFRLSAQGGAICMHEGVMFMNAASHGCIRMPVGFAERFFNAVEPAWQTTSVQIVGSIKDYIKTTVGDLLVFNKDGYPTGFKRINGRLPDAFLKALGEHRVTMFCEDERENLSLDPSKWYFSLEYWPDRRSRGVTMSEFNDTFHRWIKLSEEQIKELYWRQRRY